MLEEFKFFLANQMQSFAPKLLQLMLDRRAQNASNFRVGPEVGRECASDLI